jgi:hypothetical protein
MNAMTDWPEILRPAFEKIVDASGGNGFVTNSQIDEALPLKLSAQQIEELFNALGDKGIQVVDG